MLLLHPLNFQMMNTSEALTVDIAQYSQILVNIVQPGLKRSILHRYQITLGTNMTCLNLSRSYTIFQKKFSTIFNTYMILLLLLF
jgi:hypothetical protein